MQASDQGVLRWSEPPSQGVSVALKLAERAEAFVQAHPDQRNVIRKLFCVHLAHVPNQGDPTRKSIWLDDLTADEQALITELSGPDQRILTTGDRDGRAYAEVAHEALFNAWKELRKWISERHGFYAWATEVESDRADYEKEGRRRSALLTGRPLERAKAFMEADADDIPELDGHFIRASIKRQRIFKALIACGVGLVFVVLVAATAVYSDLYADSELLRAEAEAQTLVAKAQTAVAETERARAEQTQNEALLSQSKFLAYISINETDSGDASTGVLLALEALRDLTSSDPVQQARPYWQRAEFALDHALRLYSEKAVLNGHEGTVTAVAVSPDGQSVVTGSNDSTARIWDAGTGAERVVLNGHRNWVVAVAVSPDGQTVVTGSYDNTARIWDVFDTQALIDHAKARVQHCLTESERDRYHLAKEPLKWCRELKKWPYGVDP